LFAAVFVSRVDATTSGIAPWRSFSSGCGSSLGLSSIHDRGDDSSTGVVVTPGSTPSFKGTSPRVVVIKIFALSFLRIAEMSWSVGNATAL